MPKSIVAVVPGIMASTLTQGGKTLWSDDMFQNYSMIRKNSSVLQWLGQPASAQLWKNVTFHPIPIIGISLWANTLSYLAKRNLPVVECPYDWRQSLQDSAGHIVELLGQSQGADASLAQVAPPDSVRFDMITQSMGGLVVRTGLGMKILHPSWLGKILHLAPPLQGSPAAFRCVVDRTTLPMLNEFLHLVHLRNFLNFKNMVFDIFREFPSIYELMPPANVQFLQAPSGQQMDPGSAPQMVATLFAAAKQTHKYIALADSILSGSDVRVEVIYTHLNNGAETDCGYRYNPRSSSIEETYVSHFGDGTVLSNSASSSLAAHNRPIEDLAHMRFPNSRSVVDLYPTCGF
jgi:hypothetical protein